MSKTQEVFVESEVYTYPSVIYPLFPYINEFKKARGLEEVTIWCPFDVKEPIYYNDTKILPSNYIDVFEEAGYNVIYSHIATGQDFLDWQPDRHYDIIISTPPFKKKWLFFKRALELETPFAFLGTTSWLNDYASYRLFKYRQLQLLIPDKRIVFFDNNGSMGNRPSLKSLYYCYNFLQGDSIQWFEVDTSSDI